MFAIEMKFLLNLLILNPFIILHKNPFENRLMEPPSSSNISGMADMEAVNTLNFTLTPSISLASGTKAFTGFIMPTFRKLIML